MTRSHALAWERLSSFPGMLRFAGVTHPMLVQFLGQAIQNEAQRAQLMQEVSRVNPFLVNGTGQRGQFGFYQVDNGG